MSDERARGAAMGRDHGVPGDVLVPMADSNDHLRVAFAAGRREAPLVGFARGNDVLVPGHDLRIGQPFPFSKCDLGKLSFDGVTDGFEPERGAHDLHRFARSYERTRNIIEAFRSTTLAAEQVLQDGGAASGLRAARRVERHIMPALQPLCNVPVSKAVANIVDGGPRLAPCVARRNASREPRRDRHRHSLPTTMSGASGCFIPTM